MVEDQTRAGSWWRCGDFNILDRRYICTGNEIVDPDIAANELIHQGNLDAAINARGLDVAVNYSTGEFQSYTFNGVTETPTDATGNPISFGSSGAVVNCPVEEQTCIVTWEASNRIYGDGRNRENIADTDPQGVEQYAPQGSTTKRQVRACEVNAAGTAVCPFDSSIETLDSDCECQNLIGDAIASLSMIRTMSNDVQCYNPDTDDYEYVDAYMDAIDKLRGSDCGEDGEEPTYNYYCAVVNQTVSSSYAARCRDQFHKRAQLTELSLYNRPDNPLPLQNITTILSTDNEYQCTMTWANDSSVTITPGALLPQTNWFDICYTGFVTPAEEYIQGNVTANYTNPPSGLCAPMLSSALYTGSRPEGGCGFDNWAITNGPNRVNYVELNPGSSWPFGYIEMQYEMERTFDNNAANSFDCNGDGWLECFDCTFRDAGADCNRDCLADNNYTLCDHIEGYDCTSDNLIDYSDCSYRTYGNDCNSDCISDDDHTLCPSITGFDCDGDSTIDYETCDYRDAGFDCNGDYIADNDETACLSISGFDCNSDMIVDYTSCTLRSAGYDFDSDCLADFASECVQSATYCGSSVVWNYSAMGADARSWWATNSTGTLIEWGGCPGGTLLRTSTGLTYCNNGCATVTVSGIGDSSLGMALQASWYANTCGGIWDGYSTVQANTCCGTAISAGYDCTGTACADSACTAISGYDCNGDSVIGDSYTACPSVLEGYDCFGSDLADAACANSGGYDCGTNGGTAGNFTPDGQVDDNDAYCPIVQVGYDCYGTACADAGCTHIDGYDCGTNGGANYNQLVDGQIDNNLAYCARVSSGYDCSGSNCDGNHPTYSTFSNNRILGGTCDTPDDLADGECTVGNYRCSRFDEPGRCGLESNNITLTVPIQNNGNDYACRLIDVPKSNYEVAAFDYPNEVRFLPEGCRDALNEVYFDGTVSVTEYEIDLQYNYIQYEDLINRVAKHSGRCEWRDPMTISSCPDSPYHDVGLTDYIYIENLSNPELELVP